MLPSSIASLLQTFLSKTGRVLAPCNHHNMKGSAGFNLSNLILSKNLKSQLRQFLHTFQNSFLGLNPKCLVGHHTTSSSSFQTYCKGDIVKSSCHSPLSLIDVSCSFRDDGPCTECAFLMGCFWIFVLAAPLYNKTKGF